MDQRRVLAGKVLAYDAAMRATILVAGSQLIGVFGVTVVQFRIARGLVPGQIVRSMLNVAPVASHHGTASEKTLMAEVDAIGQRPTANMRVIAAAAVLAARLLGMAGPLMGIVLPFA